MGTGNGLNLVRRDGESLVFQRFILPGGEANNTVWNLTDDTQGNLWVVTTRGLGCLPEGADTFLFFDHSDGLPSSGFNIRYAMRSRDGRLWLGGWPGFIFFEPQRLFNRWPMVETALSSASLDGKPAQVGPGAPFSEFPPYARSLTVPAAVRRLDLNWAALDFMRPERVQFAWRFAGGDGAWKPMGFENTLTLTGLVAGRHTLQVRAANHNGRWNSKWTELFITVLAPWWRKREFLLATAAVLLLTMLAVLHGLRRYKLRLTRSLAGLPADSEPDFSKYDVSVREMEVVRLVLRGRSNKEIEDALFISISTVKAHLGSVYRKLGVKSRLQLINFAAGHRGNKS